MCATIADGAEVFAWHAALCRAVPTHRQRVLDPPSAGEAAVLATLAGLGWLEPEGERRGRRYRASRRLLNLPLRTPELMEQVKGGDLSVAVAE